MIAGGECTACSKKGESTLRRSAISPAHVRNVPPIVDDVLRSPGQPLDSQTRAFMEPRFGHDFSRVRVHTDDNAAESARAVNALAYTVGLDLVFGTAQFDTVSSSGRQLLAHELAHVVQQSPGGTRLAKWASRELGLASEMEADRAAERVTAGHLAPRISQLGPVGLQRHVDPRYGDYLGALSDDDLYDEFHRLETELHDVVDVTSVEALERQEQWSVAFDELFRRGLPAAEVTTAGTRVRLGIRRDGFLRGLMMAQAADNIVTHNNQPILDDWNLVPGDRRVFITRDANGRWSLAPLRVSGLANEAESNCWLDAFIQGANFWDETQQDLAPYAEALQLLAMALATSGVMQGGTVEIVPGPSARPRLMVLRGGRSVARATGGVTRVSDAPVPVASSGRAGALAVAEDPAPLPTLAEPRPQPQLVHSQAEPQVVPRPSQSSTPILSPLPPPVPAGQTAPQHGVPEDRQRSACQRLDSRATPIRWPAPQWRFEGGIGDPGSYDPEFDVPQMPLLVKRGSTLYNPSRPEIQRYTTRITNPPFRLSVPLGWPIHHKWPLYLGGPGDIERAEGEYDAYRNILYSPNLVVMSPGTHSAWHRYLALQPEGPSFGQGPSVGTPDGARFCVLNLV
jgi:hypothetical protein